MGTQFDISSTEAAWREFAAIAPNSEIEDEAGYYRMVAFMNVLFDATEEYEDHPLTGIFFLASDIVSRYFKKNHPE